jgi:hypothetical protein
VKTIRPNLFTLLWEQQMRLQLLKSRENRHCRLEVSQEKAISAFRISSHSSGNNRCGCSSSSQEKAVSAVVAGLKSGEGNSRSRDRLEVGRRQFQNWQLLEAAGRTKSVHAARKYLNIEVLSQHSRKAQIRIQLHLLKPEHISKEHGPIGRRRQPIPRL